MNGAGSQQGFGYGVAGGRVSASQAVGPSGRTLLEGYRKDVIGGFPTEQPRYNPLNQKRTQSSALVDLNDPIQVHLLTETALSDSKEYEILSQEEADGLKKQIMSLTQRIGQARSNLAVQSKFLDAATSMARLYSPKKKSMIGNRTSVEGSAKEAEAERQAIERRCEELASELFSLERRLMEPQRRLFQHTAGILQLTHRASKSAGPLADSQQPNGILGSPESLYTYSNVRRSADAPPEDAFFDDRSLYMTLEQLDEQTGRPSRYNQIEIPSKSPIREQANQLRGEADKLREENSRLRDENSQFRSEAARLKTEAGQHRATVDSLQLEMDVLQRESKEQLKLVSNTERKLEDLNKQLRETIVQLDPIRNAGYTQPPSGRLEPGEMLGSHMAYLSNAIATVQQEQRSLAASQASQASQASRVSEVSIEALREAEQAAAAAETTLVQAEGRIEGLNRQLCDILRTVDPGHVSPPETSGSDLNAQLSWLQDALYTIEEEFSRAADTSMATSADRQKAEQMETILEGLWDIIQTGYAGIARRKAERRRTRIEAGLEADEDDVSGDEMPMDPSEKFSLQAFSTKVQWLYAQATNLKEQKSVLKRQIKQQRDLNTKSDKEKDAELQGKIDELQQTRALLDSSEKEVKDMQQRLAQAQREVEDAKRGLEAAKKEQDTSMANVAASTKSAESQVREKDAKLKEQEAKLAASETRLKERDAKITAAQQQLDQRTAEVSSLQASSRGLQDKLTKVESDLVAISAQLTEATEAKKTAEARAAELERQVKDKEKAVKDKEEELDQLNGMVVELKTEVTIAKAELEGAYGSRSQRAAEAAALSTNSEITDLRAQADRLKKELAATLADFEVLTKDTIAAERERVDLEGRLDDALAAKAAVEEEARALRDKLDAEVAGLQERLDAEKLRATATARASGGSPRVGAGASMLSEQFRATMKEERKKFQEEMRAEQAQRRKLEEEIRILKRNQGPGKSPLSPR